MKSLFFAFCTMFACVLVASPALTAGQGAGKGEKVQESRGTIQKIDQDQKMVVLKTREDNKDVQVQLHYTPKAKFTIGERAVEVQEFKQGDQVICQWRQEGDRREIISLRRASQSDKNREDNK